MDPFLLLRQDDDAGDEAEASVEDFARPLALRRVVVEEHHAVADGHRAGGPSKHDSSAHQWRQSEEGKAIHERSDVATCDGDRVTLLHDLRDLFALLGDGRTVRNVPICFEFTVESCAVGKVARVELTKGGDRRRSLLFVDRLRRRALANDACRFEGVLEPDSVEILFVSKQLLPFSVGGMERRIGAEDRFRPAVKAQVDRVAANVRGEFLVFRFALLPTGRDQRDAPFNAKFCNRSAKRRVKTLGSKKDDRTRRTTEAGAATGWGGCALGAHGGGASDAVATGFGGHQRGRDPTRVRGAASLTARCTGAAGIGPAMPEGHAIHRLATDLMRDLHGSVVAASSPQGRFDASPADGKVFAGAAAVGKHLLLRFRDPETELDISDEIHVHLGLFGKFKRFKNGAARDSGAIRLRLVGAVYTWQLSGPTACHWMSPEEVESLRGRIGSDPLDATADPERAWATVARSRRPLGALLLDQSVFSGIGNVYRAELLFLLGVHPGLPSKALGRARFDELWRLSVELLARGVRERRIATTPKVPGVRSTKRESLYVYKRRECRRCSGPIVAIHLAGRPIYCCERCQPTEELP